MYIYLIGGFALAVIAYELSMHNDLTGMLKFSPLVRFLCIVVMTLGWPLFLAYVLVVAIATWRKDTLPEELK